MTVYSSQKSEAYALKVKFAFGFVAGPKLVYLQKIFPS